MRQYAVLVGDTWGMSVWRKVVRPNEAWALLNHHDALSSFSVDNFRYVFALNWSERIPEDITDYWDVVNFHCTPLPYGRGGHPIENMILRGHTHTNISAHRMVSRMDAGPLYCMTGQISLDGTKKRIKSRFVPVVASQIRHIVDDEPTPVPQSGNVVEFQRLSPDAYRQFWEARQ